MSTESTATTAERFCDRAERHVDVWTYEYRDSAGTGCARIRRNRHRQRDPWSQADMGSPADSFGSAVDLNLISTIENASTTDRHHGVAPLPCCKTACSTTSQRITMLPNTSGTQCRGGVRIASLEREVPEIVKVEIEHEGEVLPDNEETIKGHGDARRGRFQCGRGTYS